MKGRINGKRRFPESAEHHRNGASFSFSFPSGERSYNSVLKGPLHKGYDEKENEAPRHERFRTLELKERGIVEHFRMIDISIDNFI